MTMRRYLLVLAFVAVTLAIPAYSQAQLPTSASVQGVTNVGWPGGISNLSSYGQLIQQRALTAESTDVIIDSTGVILTVDFSNPAIDSSGIIVRSGVGTQASFVRIETTAPQLTLEPFKKVNDPVINASKLCGAGYQIGIGRPGKITPEFLRGADRSIVFANETEAFDRLKALISCGIPVQVDVDFFSLFTQAVGQEPGLVAEGQQHVSRFIVVVGYDDVASTVTYTDNGPESELGASGENVVVTQSAFLEAWGATSTLKTKRPFAGPFFMLIVTSKPELTSADFTFVFEGQNSATAPARIRLASKTATTEAKQNVILEDAPLFADGRTSMADFAGFNGQTTVAADYAASAVLWEAIVESTESTLVPDTLGLIADAEEQGLTAMRGITPSNTIELLGPPNGADVDDLGDVTFRWSALPAIGPTFLQIAAANDFNQRSTVIQVAPKSPRTSVTLTKSQIARVISKSGGTTISWRVTGVGRHKTDISEVRTLTFTAPQITALTPADGIAVTSTTLPTFSWDAPTGALRPRVVMSDNSTFAGRKITLNPRAGQSEVTMNAATFRRLQRTLRNSTDKTVFWRVEDAASSRTGVLSSETRTFIVSESM